MRLTKIIIIGMVILSSCGASVKIWNGGDMSPPQLLSVRVASSQKIIIAFNEEVDISASSVETEEYIPFTITKHSEKEILAQSLTPLEPGHAYILSIYTMDKVGNALLSINTIYGYNPDIPAILINEFICEGSKSKPDKVELLVLEDGNTAGLALQQGGVYTFNNRVYLPKINVKKGDFIVVHFDPHPQEDLSSESYSKQESNHPQAIASAWDVFSTGDKGLSNTNGSIALIALSHNTVLDAIVYTVKQDDISSKYRGFSTPYAFKWVEELFQTGAWKGADPEVFMPSDAVFSKDSTTTRSVGRNSQSEDTNTRTDWHISPSRKSSFGNTNSDEVYLPD